MVFELSREEQMTLCSYDTIAPQWNQLVFPRFKDRIWYAFTNRMMPGNGKILDIGCGTAVHEAHFVLSDHLEYFGIDISEKMLQIAREMFVGKGGITDASFATMDMRQLRFEARTFDGFIAVTSFMHVPRATLPQALAEAFRVLKYGGRGLISISKGEFEGMYTPDSTHLPVYVVCWKGPEFEKLLEQAGFTINIAEETENMLIYVVEKEEPTSL